MKQSQLFTKTRREAPADETAKNAQLLIRAGFVHKEMAGVYDFLPLGLRVLNNINAIIRKEMNAAGGQEIFLSALQSPRLWETTNRWSSDVVDVWFKTALASGGEAGLGFTHEEPLTALMAEHIASYRDLPRYAYQIQTKFRNELRAKSGLMRGREFLMKDLYSFCRDDEEHAAFYERMKGAYHRVFERVGLGSRTYITFASGGSFSKYSHEFQTVCDAGEDTVYIDQEKRIAINEEVLTDEVLGDLGLSRDSLKAHKAVEVGNIFSLGTRFSEPLGLMYRDEQGETKPVVMGCYGIGPSRLVGVVAEIFSDEKGLVWPESIAPFKVHLVSLINHKSDLINQCDDLYRELQERGVEVLYDDREASAGEKFADSDLIGIPFRVVVSEKTLAENKVELKKRTDQESRLVSREELFALLESKRPPA